LKWFRSRERGQLRPGLHPPSQEGSIEVTRLAEGGVVVSRDPAPSFTGGLD